MRSFGAKLVQAAAVAGLLCGLAATPARADDDSHRHHWNGRHHGEYREHYYRPQTHYYRDYGRDYYYEEPRVQYYAAPRVYVPAPPSFGLNLVFPFHHH